MKKLILSITILLLNSCSPPSSFNEKEEISSNKQIDVKKNHLKEDSGKKDNLENQQPRNNEQIQYCIKGCLYYYKTFKVLKEVRKNSISLNKMQIESLNNQCQSHCEQGRQDIIEENNTSNKEDIDNESIIENKKPSKKKETGGLTPFEDL